MRWVFVSDIHGQFDKLKTALDKVNFDAKRDCLISCGDVIDRGPDSYKVVEFLMSLPYKMLVAGNHEFRWKELMRKSDCSLQSIDYKNGLGRTFADFWVKGQEDDYSAQVVAKMIQAKMLNPTFKDLKNANPKAYNLFKRYLKSCVYAVKLGDFVATHAWLPMNKEKGDDWTFKTYKEWEDASWSEPLAEIQAENFLEDKTLIVGHRDTAVIRDPGAVNWFEDHSIYYSPKGNAICIDGGACKANGVVNALVIENEALPTVYNMTEDEDEGEND